MESRVTIFVSHAGRDRSWAEWATWLLDKAGYRVELDSRDWPAGDDFLARIEGALERADVILSLWSAAYFEPDGYAIRELRAASAAKKRIVPLRIEDVVPPPFWRPLIRHDLFGLDDDRAARVLVDAVAQAGGTPARVPFPGDDRAVRVPGVLPAVWNVPARSVTFTGRDDLLIRLRRSLRSGHRTAVHALHGWGGVGKTLLATEYAHRFADDYDLVWWINAERPDLIGEQLAAFAVAAGVADAGAPTPAAVQAARGLLRSRARWLMVFDNVPFVADVLDWLPQGPGDLVITSRSPEWVGVAVPLPVNVFDRAESTALLQDHVPGLGAGDADRLADALGDLPLALAQAVGVMSGTGMPATEYLAMLGSAASRILATRAPVGYPGSLAATVHVSVAHLAEADPAGGPLVSLLAMMGPEPLPLWLLAAGAEVVSEQLGQVAGDPLALRECLARAAGLGLLQIGGDSVVMHRLTQAVIRDDLGEAGRAAGRAAAEGVLALGNPGNPRVPSNWPRWSQLMAHILAIGPDTTTSDAIRLLACEAVWHLHARGDARTALAIVEQLYAAWSGRYSRDDEYVLVAATNLGVIHRVLGAYVKAREVDEDTLKRRRNRLGDDHPTTLASAHSLAIDLRRLGLVEEARQMDEDTLARRRRVLGEEHPDTLSSANNLAEGLRLLGRVDEARRMDEEILSLRRRILGEDHPYTFLSAHNLAHDLRFLGLVGEARLRDEDTLERRRRVLGEEHPDTLESAHSLAADLRLLGLTGEARKMDEDTLSRRQRVLGSDHPDTLSSARNLDESAIIGEPDS
ncbi:MULTISPECIES: FxSxx-COOH system tetratricopeptide repeat protein [Actinoplanes]|uniref:FxSxx-COOH system tetratricopeptide repeat protein n=1 Tax=Actinoplanes TaxID=1865 RepID=UPI000696FDEC|nr:MULTISPECIES: FxSxx-COOH system tetratricopeptide repeat protein [Actinoplanes]GLY02795.1 ATP-binding protein [Actinoplanes sp. NBRC 101535]